MDGHSTGPWKFERLAGAEELARLRKQTLAEHEGYFRENNGDWVVTSEDERIASVTFQGQAKRGQGYAAPDPRGQANARLISAAPELLAALRCIVADLPLSRDWLDPDLEKQARAAIAKAAGERTNG